MMNMFAFVSHILINFHKLAHYNATSGDSQFAIRKELADRGFYGAVHCCVTYALHMQRFGKKKKFEKKLGKLENSKKKKSAKKSNKKSGWKGP